MIFFRTGGVWSDLKKSVDGFARTPSPSNGVQKFVQNNFYADLSDIARSLEGVIDSTAHEINFGAASTTLNATTAESTASDDQVFNLE